MPDALRVGLLGPLLVRDEAGRAVHVGGRQLRLLLILLALDAGRVAPSAARRTAAGRSPGRGGLRGPGRARHPGGLHPPVSPL